MTKKDKEILLKDLCARLPYGVKISTRIKGNSNFRDSELSGELIDDFIKKDWGIIKPYLRSMDSMTKKEMKEYSKFAHFGNTLGDWTKSIDYLYAHHIDFRGLIPMDLALPAPEGMYNF